jgi:hypothetical protein
MSRQYSCLSQELHDGTIRELVGSVLVEKYDEQAERSKFLL